MRNLLMLCVCRVVSRDVITFARRLVRWCGVKFWAVSGGRRGSWGGGGHGFCVGPEEDVASAGMVLMAKGFS